MSGSAVFGGNHLNGLFLFATIGASAAGFALVALVMAAYAGWRRSDRARVIASRAARIGFGSSVCLIVPVMVMGSAGVDFLPWVDWLAFPWAIVVGLACCELVRR